MSYDSNITIIHGVCISQADFRLDEMLEQFIKEEKHSYLIGTCAEYFNCTRNEITEDDLRDYLYNTGYIVDDQYLDDVYIGEVLFSTDDDVFARDLAEFTELTSFNEPIWEFINKFFPNTPHKTYLVSWIC